MNKQKIIAPLAGAVLLLSGITTASAAEQAPTTDTSGVELRATLDALLSEHYVLAVDSMMKIYDGDEAAEAAMTALDENAADMEPVIASVYGEDGGAAFVEIFDKHNTGTDDYALAVKNGDEELKQEALDGIQTFVTEMGDFLGTATEGNLPADGAKEALRTHEDFVQDTFDLYVEGEYEASYMTYLEGFKQILGAGAAISGAIHAQFPDQFTDPNTPAGDFRSTVNRIAAEHFALAHLSLTKGFTASEDFDFVDWAQDQNTAEFTGAISTFYGEEAATQFEQIWTGEHLSAQSDLAFARANEDQEAIDEATQALTNAFAEELGTFLSEATEGRMPLEDTVAAIAAHEKSVIDTFNFYVTGDFDGSYSTYRDGYAIMFDLGELLSFAIVDQFPEEFTTTAPEKMPATGLGGSEANSTMNLWVALSTLILLSAGAVMYRQRKVQN